MFIIMFFLCFLFFFSLFLFFFILFFSTATVSAVLQPCRTCHMPLFFLHVVLYVFLANNWWWYLKAIDRDGWRGDVNNRFAAVRLSHTTLG